MESFQISGWGVGWGSLSYLECNRAFPVKNKGNKSYKELTEAILTKNISIFRNGGWHHLPGRVKHEASDTSRRSWEVFALVQWYTPDMRHFYLCGRSYTFCQTRHSSCSIRVLVIIWGRIKLRTKFTCVFRSCRNCPRRWINQAISTRNLAVISQWRCLNTPESPFHLAVRHNRLSNEEVWRKFGIWRHPSVKIRLESLSP